jgi:hypothetical protein
MDKHLAIATAALTMALGLAGCSGSQPDNAAAKPEVKTEASKPAEPVSGSSAFYEMYKPARQWASDIQALSLVSGEIPEMKNTDGKAAVWTATFVSPSRRAARTFTYSVATSGTNQKGISATPEQAWTGATKTSKPFQNSDFKVDSDEAYKVAFDKAQEWVAKNPAKKLSMMLASADRFPTPAWSFMWGDSKAGYRVFVNALTGKLEK